jgi:hypothetical protein
MKFTVPPNKNFKQDIEILHNALVNGENITFSKFCDGELAVLTNQNVDNGEFRFNSDRVKDITKRNRLLDAFKYNNPRYFVGITCTSVFGVETHRLMKNLCMLPEERLTWADIWVNSNYRYFVENIIPTLKNRTVVLICNKAGKIENLPFVPYIVFPVENNAWEYNWNYIEEIKYAMHGFDSENCVFLFCCGPFGNILAYELTKFAPNNTYLDIGSTLNPWLQSEVFKRDYYVGNNYFSNMVGTWDQ